MRAVRLIPGLGLLLVLASGLCNGQSLADLARQNRQQKDTHATTAKKVYTTDDMTGPECAPSQDPKSLSGTWNFTHHEGQFQGLIALCQAGSGLQGTWHTSSGKTEPDTLVTGHVDGSLVTLTRFIGKADQRYVLHLSDDGSQLDGFGEGYFLHHSNLNMRRTEDARPTAASQATSAKQ